MPIDPEIFEQDRKLADQINAEVLANPPSPYAGKFVGIANGRLVAVADNLDEIDDVLEKAEPDPAAGGVRESSAQSVHPGPVDRH